jgi:hypothetical protein
MGKWEDEIMGRRVNEIMRKRESEGMGGRENGKMRSDFVQFVTCFTIASLFRV